MNPKMKARARFVPFNELRSQHVNVDLQVHTTRTDGEADLDAVLRLAEERGLGVIAITEHVRRETDWFAEFAAEVRAARAGHAALEVLVGCETKAMDTSGTLDVTDAIRDACDIVLGSVHRMPKEGGGYVDPGAHSREEFGRMELEFALGMIETAPIDVLAHPMGMSMRKHPEFPEDAMRTILSRGKAKSVPVEINTSYLGDHFPRFLELCREIDPIVSIGSDVHKLESLGACRDKLRASGIGV